MYTIEFKQSRGCTSMHQFHHDVVDMYILYKDGQKIFSEKPDWEDYYLVLSVDNYHKEVWISKKGVFYDFIPNDFYKGFYSVSEVDYESIKHDIFNYMIELTEMLDIQDYSIKL